MVDVVYKAGMELRVLAMTVEPMLRAAEGTDFQVALRLDVKSTVGQPFNGLAHIFDLFGNQQNDPTVDGRPVVVTYVWSMWTPEQWKQIGEGLKAWGCDPYLSENMDWGYNATRENWFYRYADQFITPARSYGNSTWMLGGDYKEAKNFKGMIDDLLFFGYFEAL